MRRQDKTKAGPRRLQRMRSLKNDNIKSSLITYCPNISEWKHLFVCLHFDIISVLILDIFRPQIWFLDDVLRFCIWAYFKIFKNPAHKILVGNPE